VLWLSGWFYRKSHVINPDAGAGAGYQVRVTVHYGAGVDFGEDVYCNSLCRTDFGDIRFSDDSNNLLDYWIQSKTDGNSAVFWVEIAASLETTSQTVYVYYGKSDASTTSNQANTFVDVISIVEGWNMEEADAEVLPLVIADDNQAAFWTPYQNIAGSYDITLSNDTTNKTSGSNALKSEVNAGSYMYVGYKKDYGASYQNWSAKSKIRFAWYGANSGLTIYLRFYAPDASNRFDYTFVENFSGYKVFDLPYTAFTKTGNAAWNTIGIIIFWWQPAAIGVTRYFDRLVADIGVPVTDYSGSGNNGAAAGTIVIAGKYAGKNARNLFLGDYIEFGNKSQFNLASTAQTTGVTFQIIFRASAQPDDYARLLSRFTGGTPGAGYYLGIRKATGGLAIEWRATTNGISTTPTMSSVLDGNWHTVFFVMDANANVGRLYVDNSQVGTDDLFTDDLIDYNSSLFAGFQSITTRFVGAQQAFIIYPSALTSSQRLNVYSNYPDVTLEAGKVLVRKWASSTQPSHDVWGSVERLVVASDSFSATDGVLRDRLLDVSDSVGAADALLGSKGLLLSDSLGAVDVAAVLKTLLVSDAVGLADVFLALKGLGVADSFMLLDSVSVPLRVRTVLDSVCLTDGLTVNKTLMVAEDVFAVETVEVGTGDRRTRLFLILGNVAVQLTKQA
jgi:hypothetical protein